MKSYGFAIKLMLTIYFYSTASSFCTPILAEWQDGSTERPFEDWATSLQHQETQAAPGANPGELTLNYSGVTISIAGDPAAPNSLLYYTTAFGTVDLNNYAGMSFDFYTSELDNFGDVGFYFQTTGGNVWYYTIDTDSILAGNWYTFNASFASDAGWYGLTNNAGMYASTADFEGSLGAVNQLGFYIRHDGSAGEETLWYQIDNFGLTVPEPETYMALGMALLGMAFVFRKRITESLDEVRVAMQH